MCDFPIVFSRVSCEEAICNAVPNLFQAARDHFRKPRLVAYFIHQGVGRDEEPLVTAEGKLEDGACTVMLLITVSLDRRS